MQQKSRTGIVLHIRSESRCLSRAREWHRVCTNDTISSGGDENVLFVAASYLPTMRSSVFPRPRNKSKIKIPPSLDPSAAAVREIRRGQDDNLDDFVDLDERGGDRRNDAFDDLDTDDDRRIDDRQTDDRQNDDRQNDDRQNDDRQNDDRRIDDRRIDDRLSDDRQNDDYDDLDEDEILEPIQSAFGQGQRQENPADENNNNNSRKNRTFVPVLVKNFARSSSSDLSEDNNNNNSNNRGLDSIMKRIEARRREEDGILPEEGNGREEDRKFHIFQAKFSYNLVLRGLKMHF